MHACMHTAMSSPFYPWLSLKLRMTAERGRASKRKRPIFVYTYAYVHVPNAEKHVDQLALVDMLAHELDGTGSVYRGAIKRILHNRQDSRMPRSH